MRCLRFVTDTWRQRSRSRSELESQIEKTPNAFCRPLEITADDFCRLVMADPAVVESVATAAAKSRARRAHPPEARTCPAAGSRERNADGAQQAAVMDKPAGGSNPAGSYVACGLAYDSCLPAV